MFGILEVVNGGAGRRVAVLSGVKRLGGGRFFVVSTVRCRSGLLWTRRLHRAVRVFQRAGVGTVIFPAAFDRQALFEKAGVAAAGEETLRRRTAGAAARVLLAQHGLSAPACCALLLGDHMSADLRRTLTELALHVRYTMLCAGGGGGEVCSMLRREYGISVLREPGAEQLARARLQLTFGAARPVVPPPCLWLPCGACTAAEGFENSAPYIQYAVPEPLEASLGASGASRNALLSALLEMGTLRPEEVEVTEIRQNA